MLHALNTSAFDGIHKEWLWDLHIRYLPLCCVALIQLTMKTVDQKRSFQREALENVKHLEAKAQKVPCVFPLAPHRLL